MSFVYLLNYDQRAGGRLLYFGNFGDLVDLAGLGYALIFTFCLLKIIFYFYCILSPLPVCLFAHSGDALVINRTSLQNVYMSEIAACLHPFHRSILKAYNRLCQTHWLHSLQKVVAAYHATPLSVVHDDVPA